MTFFGRDLDLGVPLNRITRGKVGQIRRMRLIEAPDLQ